MSLVPSLLQAIVGLDGAACVIHVGDTPYVIAPSGQVDLATRGLTFETVDGILKQLLPVETLNALDEFGAIQYELPASAEFRHERFTVVAARGGDDVWVEIRRKRAPEEDRVLIETFATPEPIAAHDPESRRGDGLLTSDSAVLWPDVAETPSEAPLYDEARDLAVPAPAVEEVHLPASVGIDQPPRPSLHTVPPPVLERAEPAQPAMVLPLSRNPVRGDASPRLTGSFSGTGLDRLLRIAAARGASTLYLASLAKPSIRVDGEIQMLDKAALGPSEVEALLIDLMPERNREALRSGVGTEWMCDVPDVGRVRCMTFRDHRGAGGIFRMMPVRAISADQLGLSREIQALAAEPEGLVLVAGPRSSGKSTLISAFVDLINRTRRDHVITIESEIKVVHENRQSLVSQREVRGDADQMLAVARAAIRENPDVLVIEELRTADMITVALDAANSGHLVIGALPAHTASGAVDRIIDVYPPEYRRHVQLALAENLRGIVAQVLVRKPGGGRIAAREVLLNTSAVASVIAEGKTSQLPLAIEGGRKHGMLPLNDSLVGFVQSGVIDAREAYRRAADRTGFLALLKRQGIDISFAERLA